MAKSKSKRHLACFSCDLYDSCIEKDDDGEDDSFDFFYYCPAASRIDISGMAISEGIHYYESPTNSWSIYVNFNFNDMGAACFYTKQYERAIDFYIKYRDSNKDNEEFVEISADCDYNVFEACNQWSSSHPGDFDLQDKVSRLYAKSITNGKHSSEFWFLQKSKKVAEVERLHRVKVQQAAQAAVEEEALEKEIFSKLAKEMQETAPKPPFSETSSKTNSEKRAAKLEITKQKSTKSCSKTSKSKSEVTMNNLSLNNQQPEETFNEKPEETFNEQPEETFNEQPEEPNNRLIAIFDPNRALGLKLCTPYADGPAVVEEISPETQLKTPSLKVGTILESVNMMYTFFDTLAAIRNVKANAQRSLDEQNELKLVFRYPKKQEQKIVSEFLLICKESCSEKTRNCQNGTKNKINHEKTRNCQNGTKNKINHEKGTVLETTSSSTKLSKSISNSASAQIAKAISDSKRSKVTKKEIRFLKKKLREICLIENKSLCDLNDDQKSKLKRKSIYEQRLCKLEK